MPTDLMTLQDPRSQYPGPPSSVEIQSAPAIQANMSEKPDCGEVSYKGSGRLAGRRRCSLELTPVLAVLQQLLLLAKAPM